MGSPLHPIPYDVVLHNIIPYLNVQDLGRFMRVNRTYCSYLLRDEVWDHIRQRCLRVAPLLQPMVFGRFPWHSQEYNDEEGVRKKARLRESQKRPFKLPRGGTWYVLKTYIAKARSAATFKPFMNFKAHHMNEAPGIFYFHNAYTCTRHEIHDGVQNLTTNYNLTRHAIMAFVGFLQTQLDEIIVSWDRFAGQLVFRESSTMQVLLITNPRYLQWEHTFDPSTPGFRAIFWGF